MYIDEHGHTVFVGQEAITHFLKGIRKLREGRKLHYKTTFQDLPISIENRKGSIRRGTDPDGNEWETKHKHPYGYIPGTKGPDGDGVDVFVGPNEDASHAYVVHIKNPDTGKYDEDKVFLGFDSKEAALKSFRAHYDEPNKFFDSVDEIPMWKFSKKVFVKKHTTKKLVASRGGNPTILPYDRGQQMVAPIAMVARFYPDMLGSLETHEQIEAFPDIESPDTIPIPLKKKKSKEAEGASLQVPKKMFGPDKMPNYGGQSHIFTSMKKSILGHHQDIMQDPEVREAEEYGVKGMKWGVRHARKDAASSKHPVTGKAQHATKRAVVSAPDRTLNMMGGDVAKGNAALLQHSQQNQQQAQQGKPVDPKAAHSAASDALKQLGWKAAGALARVAGVGGLFDSVQSIFRSPGGQKVTLKTDKQGNHSLEAPKQAATTPEKGQPKSAGKGYHYTPRQRVKDKESLLEGGPGSGRHKTLYHGTTIANAKSILEKGFNSKKFGKKQGGMEEPETISLTSNKKTAGSYGGVDSLKGKGKNIRLVPGGGTGAIIKVSVPESMLKGRSHDVGEGSEAADEYNIPKKLGKEYIESVEIYDHGKKTILHPNRESYREAFEERLGSFLREARKQVYYARSLQHYGSAKEARDLDFLAEAYPGFRINSPKTRRHAELGMGHFHKKIDKAKEVIIRSYKKGHVTAGVASEANHALKNGIPVRLLHEGKLRRVKRIDIREGGRPGGMYARVILRKRKKRK